MCLDRNNPPPLRTGNCMLNELVKNKTSPVAAMKVLISEIDNRL